MSPKPWAQYEKPYCAWTLNPRPHSQAVVAVIPDRVFVPCIRIILLWVFVRYIRIILLWVFVPCLACPIVVAEDCQIWTWKSAFDAPLKMWCCPHVLLSSENVLGLSYNVLLSSENVLLCSKLFCCPRKCFAMSKKVLLSGPKNVLLTPKKFLGGPYKD